MYPKNNNTTLTKLTITKKSNKNDLAFLIFIKWPFTLKHHYLSINVCSGVEKRLVRRDINIFWNRHKEGMKCSGLTSYISNRIWYVPNTFWNSFHIDLLFGAFVSPFLLLQFTHYDYQPRTAKNKFIKSSSRKN